MIKLANKDLLMEEIYLTPELKSYYINDFNSVITLSTDFWGIDNGLKDVLININKSSAIQTLYSKKHDFHKTSFEYESYLIIAYKKEVELELFRFVIPEFLILFNTNEYQKFSYSFELPVLNSNYRNGESHFNIGCINNEKYFFVNNIKFELISDNEIIHNTFWKHLETKLFILNC